MFEEMQFPYRPRPFLLLFCTVFTAAGAWALMNNALLGTDAEFEALGLVGMPAAISLGALSALCVGASAFCAYMVWNGLTSQDKLVLGSDALYIPSGKRGIEIPYSDIRTLKRFSVTGAKGLAIFYREKEASVLAAMLGNRWRFNRVVKLIEERAEHARGNL